MNTTRLNADLRHFGMLKTKVEMNWSWNGQVRNQKFPLQFSNVYRQLCYATKHFFTTLYIVKRSIKLAYEPINLNNLACQKLYT